ncbi:hypothetical protein A1O7_02696 [Cladophialophora yegresii CBS 114405]|uniref:Ketoreductase (KR) domain-containing protein n=1 Tax=Cladophialophora yegresii CBS 114405 TaxID=1182544 RepID=W9W2R5_9EURO|nr:uncharacterized protein A1O7_02696 [Cladophialophora yegresii CBS 114405]EXJ62263.1 hypothetical protein A1O7_02696 [Cladophialophora yegresii CBS 114405]
MSTCTRSVLVTGGTTGNGFRAAVENARRRPDHCIVVASRKDNAHSAKASVEKLGQTNVQSLSADLGDQKNVRSFVESWEKNKFRSSSPCFSMLGLQILC